MSSYYKHVALDETDRFRIWEALHEVARRRSFVGDYVLAAGFNETARRVNGQIHEQQTSEERQADIRDGIFGRTDSDDDDDS